MPSAYVVFVCSGCGRFLVAKAGQRNKRCNYCESLVDLWRAKRVASAGSAREASALVREFKMREGNKECV
jgi:LSD1 subclass zinc finger protein